MSLALPDRLVSTAWLGANLADPDLRIFDCSVTLVPAGSGVRPESGRAAWEQGHIPGSGFADLLEDLSDKSQPLPIMMPPAAQFAAAMGRYGVGSHECGGPLRQWPSHLGHQGLVDAAGHGLRQCGRARWRAEEVEGRRARAVHGPLRIPACAFRGAPTGVRARGQGSRLSPVRPAAGPAHQCTLRRRTRWPGVAHGARPGRIPGSGNVPAGSLLDPATGAFLPLAQLRDKFQAQGALDGRSVITYCGGGIAATCAAFTLVRLGVPDVAVYDGSLTEWSRDDSLPMESDDFIPS